ncbi:hypothetical protein V6N12_034895 [Hibiscus sabdariffa]|uniref:Uncharacterized protein n=1 Tax=Hibiscus sabdariffa TaxID=183260 RepID=A0ABR2BQK8_9ROSI
MQNVVDNLNFSSPMTGFQALIPCEIRVNGTLLQFQGQVLAETMSQNIRSCDTSLYAEGEIVLVKAECSNNRFGLTLNAVANSYRLIITMPFLMASGARVVLPIRLKTRKRAESVMNSGTELGKLGLIQIGEEDSVGFERNITVSSTWKEDNGNDVVLQSDLQRPSCLLMNSREKEHQL